MYNNSPILGISGHTAESIETWIAKWLADELKIQVDSIDTCRSFVRYGIDSLTLLMLTDDLGLWLQRRLPPTLFWEHNSIKATAHHLAQERISVPGTWSSLVKIQPNGSKPPFFGIHGKADNVIQYYNLARYWNREQPVYGLQPQGLDGKQVPHNRFEDMATQYIREIRTIQPEGPYFLGGYSMGGVIALEMAQQFQAQGQKVAMLALFDSHGPEWIKPLPFHALISRKVANLLRLEPKEKLTYVKNYVKRKLSNRFYLEPQEHHESELQYQSPLVEAHNQAIRDYVYQIYSGYAILFRAIEQHGDEFQVIDPQLGWSRLVAGGLEIQEVPGNHYSMFSEPYVRVLAEKSKACLEQAQVNLEAN